MSMVILEEDVFARWFVPVANPDWLYLRDPEDEAETWAIATAREEGRLWTVAREAGELCCRAGAHPGEGVRYLITERAVSPGRDYRVVLGGMFGLEAVA